MEVDESLDEVYEFSECRLNTTKRILTQGEETTVRLTRLEYRFLLHVVTQAAQNREQLEREDLCQYFWNGAAAEFDGHLRGLYRRVRIKLGDVGEHEQRHINTETTGFISLTGSVRKVSPRSPDLPPPRDSRYPQPGHFYYIVSRCINLAVDVPRATLEVESLHLWELPGWVNNQLWHLVPVGEGYHMLLSKRSGKCLDVNGAAICNGAKVLQYMPTRDMHQQWMVLEGKEGFFNVEARHSGQVLTRDELEFSSGAKVQMSDPKDSPDQDWDFIRHDHLLLGRHFLIDGRALSGDGKHGPGSLGLILDLLVELARRRATFTCWFAESNLAADIGATVSGLCQRFPGSFATLGSFAAVTSALLAGSLANPTAEIILGDEGISDFAGCSQAIVQRVLRMESTGFWLTVASIDLAVHGGDYRSIQSRLATRLVPAWRPIEGAQAKWLRIEAGEKIPEGALVGGREAEGPPSYAAPLYVCRGWYAGTLQPGKVVQGKCNIAFKGREVALPVFEVPVVAGGEWGEAEPGCASSLIAGEEDGNALVVGRAAHKDGLHPGKVTWGECHFGFGETEVASEHGAFEVFKIPGG